MSKGSSAGSKTTVAGEFNVHAQGFFATLESIGYSQTTQHEKRCMTRRFTRWARRARRAIASLDEACVERFLAQRRHKPRKIDRATAQQFVEYLRAIGVVPPRCASTSKPSSGELLIRKYLAYLRSDRGLCERSVEVYAPFVCAFVMAQELPQRIRLPLLQDVGEALALYIREARVPSSSRRVFLRCCAPYVGLSGPTAVCLVVRHALRHAGLAQPGRVGAHVFRHSLATGMIRRGASLAEIAQVLRHRSLDTTQLYTKVALEALSDIALPWPTTEVHP